MSRAARARRFPATVLALAARHVRQSRLPVLALMALLPWIVAATPDRRAPAPPFKVTAIGGEVVELEALRSRGPVLIDFWATWCKPCIAALPEIEALHRRLRDRGLTVVGVSVDGPRNFAKVRPMVARIGLTYPIVLDQDGSLQSRYQIKAMPTTVLIDTSGTVVKVLQGYRPGEFAELARRIEELLGTPDRTPGSDN